MQAFLYTLLWLTTCSLATYALMDVLGNIKTEVDLGAIGFPGLVRAGEIWTAGPGHYMPMQWTRD